MVKSLLNGLSERHANDILHGLLESISEVADARHDLGTLLVAFSQMAHRLVPSDRCTVWVNDRQNKTLWTSLADGIDKIEVPETAGVVGAAFQTGESLVINNPYMDPRFNPQIDRDTGYVTKNIIAIPLVATNGEVIGVFQALNKLTGGDRDSFDFETQGYTDQDLQLLRFVSVYIARETDSAILRQELEETQSEIIYTLAETGEMRSKETGNHVKRVASYCRFLAEKLGMPEREVEIIGIASTLHDIGKIAIPDAILLKPGRLTPEEFGIMKTHAKLGYEMLKHSNRTVLRASAIIAGQHHEKWDGSGYPKGLAGENIHIYGRIAALADVYDALSCRRCYKEAWDHSRIVDLLKEERGSHFDPHLIDIFLENDHVFQKISIDLADDNFCNE